MRDLALGTTGPVNAATLAGRLILYLFFLAWGWAFFSPPTATVVLDSFMHMINLPFHEAGHILFSPFGPFLTSLGGSLGQLLVPAICAGALLVQTRDPFGASLCVWWLGQNFIDVAPYIDDARTLQLVLLGGRTGAEVEGHDWEAILGALGWLRYDHAIARASHRLGVVLMATALAWGALVLVSQFKNVRIRPASR